MRALLLHNPQAGAGGHTEKELVAALKLGGLTVDYCSTKGGDFPAALSRKTDCYVVAGGDGTIAEVATRLEDRRIPIGLIPLGTANNVARSFAIAGTPQDLSERFDLRGLRRLDIGLALGPWGQRRFVEAVGLGTLALAMASKKAADRPSGARKIDRGRKTLMKVLRDQSPAEISIEVDGTEHRDAYLAVEILNTASSGPALTLAPDADPGDGWLDVVLIRESDREAFGEWIAAPAGGRPVLGKVIRARRVSFEWRGAPLRIDDEAYDTPNEPSRISVEVEPVPVLVMGLSPTLQDARQQDESRATA